MTTTTTRTSKPSPPGRVRGDRVEQPPVADHAWVVEMVVAINAVVIVGMWVRHGGISAASGPGGIAKAAGEITGLRTMRVSTGWPSGTAGTACFRCTSSSRTPS